MRDLALLLSLPSSILLLLATSAATAQDLPWPYNLPRTAKYLPEHEAQIKRDLEIQQRLSWQEPAGVKKMSDDEGEKFFLGYWDFGPQSEGWETADRHERLDASNQSTTITVLDAPIAPHTGHDRPHIPLFGRSLFARNFQCPGATTSCSSIGSDLCCPTSQSCVKVSGGVGCCPSGQSCGTVVGSCDTSAGYTDCPNSPNGGCCIPGAQCEGTGCVFYGTQTVVTTLPTSVRTSSAAAPPTSSDSPTTPAVPIAPAATSAAVLGYTTTVTVTKSVSGQMTTIIAPTTVIVSPSPSSTPSTTSTPTTQGTLTCTTGFQSCPASLGGGCCPTGQVCGTASLCLDPSSSPTTTTTAAAGPPIRPTSVSVGTTDNSFSAALAPSRTTTPEACPTGFYMCSAYYVGGCCRVGRNCDTSSCPTSDSTAVVSSGATVIVPATATTTTGDGGAAAGQGSCANGWYGCAASVGGGCCPFGLACGTASCSATVSGQSNTGKEAPSGAAVNGCAWTFGAIALMAGVGMVWL